MDILYNIIIALYAILIMSTMIAILSENRQPTRTIAWLLVLWFLPVVGIILFFFFGQRIRQRRKLRRKSVYKLTKHKNSDVEGQKDDREIKEFDRVARLFYNQDQTPALRAANVEIYQSGKEFIDAILDAVAHSKHHIHFLSFIFEDDKTGNMVADALIEKAKQGIEVRLIYDYVGSWHFGDKVFSRMKKGGVQVHSFMPVRFPRLTSRANYRNHRKIIVIDGTTGFIGGMNIADRYVWGTKEQAWRDIHTKVTGTVVCALQRTFLLDWSYVAHENVPSSSTYFPAATGNTDNGPVAQIVTSSPVSEWPNIMQGYVSILLSAKHYVYMETPYFIPTEPILSAMRTAAISGVDIRLMVPRHSDSKVMEWVTNSNISILVEAGVKVYLYRPAFNHSKLLIADDYLSTCGSANIDVRSFEQNFECNIFFYDQPTAMRFKAIFLADERKSTRLSDISKPFHIRLFEGIVRLLSPLL